MKYFKVIKGDKHDYFTGWTTIENELLTVKERNNRFPHLNDDCFKPVELSSRRTYMSFGTRFEQRSVK